MNYYERHLGDYAKDTSHLSLIEHGAYTLLLDRIYSTEMPVSDQIKYRVCRARSTHERQAVDRVLDEFFHLSDDGWICKRASQEIEKYQIKQTASRRNGAKGGRPKNVEESKEAQTHRDNSGFQKHNPEKSPPVTSNQSPVTISNNHIPSDVKLTPGLIAKTLRPLNISITSQNPILLAWISDGFTLDEITESVDICKTKLGDKKPIAAKYLDAVIRSERTQQPTSRDKPNGKSHGPPWWASEKGIEAKGRELGMWPARTGESWQAYKGRIEAKLQEVKS